MGAARPVLIAVDDPRLESAVVAAARAARLPSRVCADLAELLAAAGAGVGGVAVVGSALAHLDRSAVMMLTRSGVRVLGANLEGDATASERLRRLGLSAGLSVRGDAEQDARDLVRAQAEAVGAPSAAPQDPRPSAWRELDPADLEQWWGTPAAGPRHGSVLAVWGPTGAPGRTTVAVTLAGCAVRRGAEVLLVDLDPYGGGVASALRMPVESPGVVRALRAADEGLLDVEELRAVVVRSGGIDVLTGLPTADRWPELRPAGVAGLLEVAREAADLVVVDTGFCLEDDAELSYDTAAPRRNAATLTTLEEADRIVAVGQAGPLAMPRLVAGLAELRRIDTSADVSVVVNRTRASVLGPAGVPGVAADLARLCGVPEPVFVPDDPLRVDTALVEGRSLVATAPGSAVCTALDTLLDEPRR